MPCEAITAVCAVPVAGPGEEPVSQMWQLSRSQSLSVLRSKNRGGVDCEARNSPGVRCLGLILESVTIVTQTSFGD
jgi:hypothetical protein